MTQNNIELRIKQANEFLQSGQPLKAKDIYTEICKITPEDSDAWLMAAAISGEIGLVDEAIDFLQKAIALEPDFAEAHFTYASILQNESRPEEALEKIKLALEADNDYPEAWVLKSGLEGSLGLYKDAITSSRIAIEQLPDSIDAYINMGNAFQSLENHEQASYNFGHALSINPNFAPANISMAESLISLSKIDEAQQYCNQAEQLTPDDPALLRIKAKILQRKGCNQEAYDLLKPMIANDLLDVSAAVTLCKACAQLGNSAIDNIIPVIENLLADPETLPPGTHWKLEMEIGRLYDRLKDYDTAFKHFETGHNLADSEYNPSTYEQIITQIKTTYHPENLSSLPKSSIITDLPIFIVGMPRSGTTLVEQILCSHPDIYGAGELTNIENISQNLKVLDPGQANALDDTEQFASQINEVAEKYIDHLTALSSGTAKRVTDKLPGNYHHLGLINLLFPNAKVIHCLRSPLDTCLSCYIQSFTGHDYIHNLSHLGYTYLEYERLMDYWHSVLEIPILDIHYEDLIENTEESSRLLVDFSGLDWDEGCLEFYNNKRTVKTASYDQVNKPIYNHSLERWRNYEKHLSPLITALGI